MSAKPARGGSLIRNTAIPEGASIAASVVFRDVTRLRTVEEDLRKAMNALEKVI